MQADTAASHEQRRSTRALLAIHPLPSHAPAVLGRALCSTCHLREFCLPGGVSPRGLASLDRLPFTRRRAHLGETLYEAGQGFGLLYAVRCGTFKSCITLADGREQVTGFHLPGELLGLDGVGSGAYASSAVALEDGEVCVIPYAGLRDASSVSQEVQDALARLMSREIVREHSLMLMLGSMNAEERLAAFLLSLSSRMHARGFSATEFHLRMSRAEIGSYLGMKLETVSRTFALFVQHGMLAVDRKHIRIVDLPLLQSAFAMRVR